MSPMWERKKQGFGTDYLQSERLKAEGGPKQRDNGSACAIPKRLCSVIANSVSAFAQGGFVPAAERSHSDRTLTFYGTDLLTLLINESRLNGDLALARTEGQPCPEERGCLRGSRSNAI